MTVCAPTFHTDVPLTPTASLRRVPSFIERRPQATHRYLTRDDFRWGCDPAPPSPPRASRQVHQRKVFQPQLPTIWEDWRLRCRRVELDDPRSGTDVRYSAIYCPPVYSSGHAPGAVRVVHNEYLENFAILRPQQGQFVNVTRTMNVARRTALHAFASELFRDAFVDGRLH